MQDVTEKEKKEAGEKTESGVKEFVCGEYNFPVATLCVEIKNAASIITHQPYCGEIHLSVITPPPEYAPLS